MTPPPKPKRFQSQTERDHEGIAAKREREAAPPFVEPEITGNYTGEELAEMRATQRPMPTRISRLEQKHDSLDAKVGDIDTRTARMEGKLDTALALIIPERSEAHKTERHKVDARTKVIIAIVGAIGTAIGVVATVLSGCA